MLVKETYELFFLFSVNSFESPKDISANKLVQFSFCHIYYDSLVDMPKDTKMEYKSATQDDINTSIKKIFNITGVDIMSSDLYNKVGNIFEMWQPNYHTDVYYKTNVAQENDESYKIDITFYTDSTLTTQKANKTIYIEKSENNYYITKMV